jgi:lipopolysaccharide biosynthesis glycosyltransferase
MQMKTNVLVALADSKFLSQAKQLFSTVYWNSGWQGDYLLLAYDTPEEKLSWFREKGIIIKHCAPVDCGSERFGDKICSCKYYMFTEFFKQWDNVVYLDVDIVTKGPIENLTKIDSFSACHSLGQTIKDNIIAETPVQKELLNKLAIKYDLNKKAFNAGVMSFPTSVIHKDMFDEVLEEIRKHVKIARFGGDQLAINLYFYDRWKELLPIYNQIAPLGDTKLDKNLCKGLVIHCVCLGNGPWDKSSVFYNEWKQNFDKADSIDLKNIPKIAEFSEKEIKEKCKSVVSLYLVGGKMNLQTMFKFLFKAFILAISNPQILFNKLKNFRK